MKRLGAALAYALASAASAQSIEPFSFKDWVLGSDIELARKNVAFKCSERRSSVADTVCSQTGGLSPTIAGVDATGVALFYLEGKLSSIAVGYKSNDFDKVAAALTERWGAPSAKRRTPVRTRGGIEYTNDIWTWTRDASHMIARRYGSNITEGGVIFSLDNALETMREREQGDTKARAKDL